MWDYRCKNCEYCKDATVKQKKYKVCMFNKATIIHNSEYKAGRPKWCPLDVSKEDRMNLSINNWLW